MQRIIGFFFLIFLFLSSSLGFSALQGAETKDECELRERSQNIRGTVKLIGTYVRNRKISLARALWRGIQKAHRDHSEVPFQKRPLSSKEFEEKKKALFLANDAVCSLCQDDLSAGTEVLKHPCDCVAFFHPECLEKLLMERSSCCIICKQNARTEDELIPEKSAARLSPRARARAVQILYSEQNRGSLEFRSMTGVPDEMLGLSVRQFLNVLISWNLDGKISHDQHRVAKVWLQRNSEGTCRKTLRKVMPFTSSVGFDMFNMALAMANSHHLVHYDSLAFFCFSCVGAGGTYMMTKSTLETIEKYLGEKLKLSKFFAERTYDLGLRVVDGRTSIHAEVHR